MRNSEFKGFKTVLENDLELSCCFGWAWLNLTDKQLIKAYNIVKERFPDKIEYKEKNVVINKTYIINNEILGL